MYTFCWSDFKFSIDLVSTEGIYLDVYTISFNVSGRPEKRQTSFDLMTFTCAEKFKTLPYESRHDKTNKMSVRPAKTQISMGIRPV